MSVQKRRILVSLYHSYIDTSSGAAISLRDLMEALAKRNWEVRVLSGPRLDFEARKTNEELLREQGIVFQRYRNSTSDINFRLLMFRTGGVDCALFEPKKAQADPSQPVGNAWLSLYQETLKDWRPDVVLTYGGFWMFRPMMHKAKMLGTKRVFFLCNCEYRDQGMFKEVDLTIVPSRWHQNWCREVVGIETEPVYSLIPPKRYLCVERNPQYLTFVNPQPAKGVFIFSKVIEILQKTRPDIPILVVESRGQADWLSKTGAELTSKNLFRMKNTPDPRDYLKVTKIMFVPSVFNETFGRVAAEAMMNGIPVVGSNRGSLPEVIGDERFSLPIPESVTPSFRGKVSAEDIKTWVQVIEKLWDDKKHYTTISGQAISQAGNWSEESIVESFETLI